jgi:hypothetical protein
MQMIPTFEMKTPDRDTARRFVDACIKSGKFVRTADSKILWGQTGDWVQVIRAHELYWLLIDGMTIEYRGDTSDETIRFLWQSLFDQKFKLPRVHEVRS